MKYSFIMPYYKRNDLFRNTLESYKQFYSNRHDWEIVVTEDYKNQTNEEEHNKLLNTLKEYVSTIPIGVIARPQEYILNPAPHFNCAATVARGQYLILTNPECQHETDILAGFDKIFEQDSNAYIVSACYDPFFGWKQHTQHENRLLHWCNGISKFNFFRLGGFDVNYINGIAYEDDDFAMKVKKCEFLNIYPQDDLLIKHQTHDFKPNQILWDINHEYFVSKWGINQPRVILKDFNCNYSIIIIYNGNLEIIKKSLESYIPLYSKRSDFDIVIAVPAEQANNNILQLREIIYPFNQYFNIIFLPYIGQNIPIINYAIHYGNGKNVVLSTDSYLHTEDILSVSDDALVNHENDVIAYDNKLIMSRKIPETIAFKDGCGESVFLEFIERVKQSGVKIVIQNPTEEKKMYKIVLITQVYNELSKDNLKRFMKYTKPLVDDMVFYDDGSTDGSYEYLIEHTNNVIRSNKNDFKNEISHKQQLLDIALNLNADFILWLDADEILTYNLSKERLQSLCKQMVDNNNTGMLFREINIWRSNTYSRLDRTFGGASFCRLWRVTPGMHYNIATGLHQPQYPSGISPDTSAPSDTGILHYGFSSVKNLAFKYFIYESHGQAQVHGQWALDMFIDEGGMQLESLPKEMFPAELYTENEQKPSPILFDDFFELIQPYKEKAVHSQPPIILSNDIVTGPLGEKFLWDYMLEGINNILGLDCRNVLNIQKDWHLMPRDFSEKISNHIKQNYSDSEIIIQNATWMDTLCPEKYTIAFLQDALRPMGGANPQQEKNLKQAKLVVTNSHYTASFYPEYYPVVIPIGIDQKIFHPIDKQQVRQEFGFDNRQTGIFVGSYSDIKGWVEVQQLIEKYPNIFWIIVTKDLYKLSDTLNSKHYSRIDHGVLIKLLNCADFFILGSPIETECLAALQAGFCNVPIVMHKTGIFANMTLGQQSKLGCFDDNLEKAMLTVIQNLSQHSPLEELISQGLTIENTIEQWKKLLDKVQSELTSPNVENKTVEIKANEVSPELNIIKKCIIDISDQYAIKEEKEWDVNPWTFWAKGTFYQRLRLKDVAEASLRLFQGNIIEIGAGVGEQTIRFAELAREYGRKVIVIDPWIINQQHYSYLPVDDFQVFDYLSRNYKPYIDVIRSSSLDSDIVEFLKKQEIAFAFVDGLHLYEPCKIDISSVWHASVMAVDDLLQLPEECNTAFREYTNINNSYWNKSLNEGYIIPKII